MQNYLQARAQEQLAEHRQAMLGREDPEEIRAWQQEMRAWLEQAIGGLPPSDTPLNAQVTGTIEREGFKVEKILFESQPGFFVTAALFLPTGEEYAAPYPAVLVACGHSQESKAYDVYQRGCALLALNGVAALVFDPIDQGERLQTREHEGHAPHWGVLSHNELGIGAMLLGTNTSQFMIHDAMRCLDYLQSRDDIDGENLGMAGNSGGGTQTALVMAAR